eukprot:COSAG01_NODE_74_length_28433_cov_41.582269_30_plen_164_part_00
MLASSTCGAYRHQLTRPATSATAALLRAARARRHRRPRRRRCRRWTTDGVLRRGLRGRGSSPGCAHTRRRQLEAGFSTSRRGVWARGSRGSARALGGCGRGPAQQRNKPQNTPELERAPFCDALRWLPATLRGCAAPPRAAVLRDCTLSTRSCTKSTIRCYRH